MVGRDSKHLHHQAQLITLVLAREYRVPHGELSHDAAKTKHVDGWCVWDSQYNLRGAVKARLDVGVHPFSLEAARAEVNNLDARFGRVLE